MANKKFIEGEPIILPWTPDSWIDYEVAECKWTEAAQEEQAKVISGWGQP